MTARKVLIVEDNAALLRGLKDNFQAQGYQVRTANDGAKGLEAFFNDPPDLVLLDLMLPKVNGSDDYVTKPFGIRELLARAKRLSKSRAGVPPARVPGASEDSHPVAAGILPAVEPGILPGGMAICHAPQASPGGRMPPSTAGKMPAATAQVGGSTGLRCPARGGLPSGVAASLPSLPGDSRHPEP
jgi:CheY-like chemotaxis protein